VNTQRVAPTDNDTGAARELFGLVAVRVEMIYCHVLDFGDLAVAG
jgi:hypothetical protein